MIADGFEKQGIRDELNRRRINVISEMKKAYQLNKTGFTK
ncbi:Uncharacterised protein [Rodentibacter pneumotropicus]|uniref:Uncharacterized protein n=1 Tax=Rodentibacter pneumotropicus TaxID=758 RepID=A0A448MN25_9PAST|nr:Uncharacterised protein [Rodentibacter pneumotropicus]